MRIVFLSLISLFLLACSAPKKLVKPNLESVTYRQLLQFNEDWQKSIESLRGDTRITLDTPQYSGNFSAGVLLNGEDSLLISVTGPLGIKVGRVFIASKRFVFYNQVMNQFFTGSKKDFEGTNFLQFPLEITQLRSVFVAQDRFDILKKEHFGLKDNMYYLEAANDHLSYRIWFDPALFLIRKIEYLDKGEVLFYKEYDQFKKVNGIHFPQAISFVRPQETQGLSIFFNDLKINEPFYSEEFKIKISDSAKQIDLSLEK